jgi:hypothetical protein
MPMCPEKKRLLDEIGDAMKWMISLQNGELERVIRGELPEPRNDGQMERARELKERFTRQLKEHVEKHGC